MPKWKCEVCIDIEDGEPINDEHPCIFQHPDIDPEVCILTDYKGHEKAKWQRL